MSVEINNAEFGTDPDGEALKLHQLFMFYVAAYGVENAREFFRAAAYSAGQLERWSMNY